MNPPERALFIQLRRIGDILMCTPAVRAFKKKYPNCTLDFLTEHPDVLQGNPRILCRSFQAIKSFISIPANTKNKKKSI